MEANTDYWCLAVDGAIECCRRRSNILAWSPGSLIWFLTLLHMYLSFSFAPVVMADFCYWVGLGSWRIIYYIDSNWETETETDCTGNFGNFGHGRYTLGV